MVVMLKREWFVIDLIIDSSDIRVHKLYSALVLDSNAGQGTIQPYSAKAVTDIKAFFQMECSDLTIHPQAYKVSIIIFQIVT